MIEPLLTLDEVASVLKVDRVTAWRRIKSGALKCVRDGRVIRCTEQQLRDYIDAKSTVAEPGPKPRRNPKYGH